MSTGQKVIQKGKDCDFATEDEYDDDLQDQVHYPQQRNAANARERARMRVLSKAFCRLKTTLPWVPPDTKLSKLDTLRLATGYIAHLRAILKLSESETRDPTMQPLNMSWPFNFHMNWDSQTSSKSITAAASKGECSTFIQYPTNKTYHEEECKAYYDFNSEKRLSPNRNTRNRRRSNVQENELSRSLHNYGNSLETDYYKSYKSCAYFE